MENIARRKGQRAVLLEKLYSYHLKPPRVSSISTKRSPVKGEQGPRSFGHSNPPSTALDLTNCYYGQFSKGSSHFPHKVSVLPVHPVIITTVHRDMDVPGTFVPINSPVTALLTCQAAQSVTATRHLAEPARAKYEEPNTNSAFKTRERQRTTPRQPRASPPRRTRCWCRQSMPPPPRAQRRPAPG